MAKQKLSRLTQAVLNTADGLHPVSAMDDTYARIAMRHLGKPTGAVLTLLNLVRRKAIKVAL